MTDPNIWDKEIPVPDSAISYVDDAIKKKLPEGTTVLGISPSGSSYWARTAKIDAVDADGNATPFFMKVLQEQKGLKTLASEFFSMSTLYKIIPEMVAKPIGFGSFNQMEDTHFYVCRFTELSDDVPELYDFPALVADFHKRAPPPDGRFGWPRVTYGGRNPQFFPPSDTWEECFTEGMKQCFVIEEETHGPDEELSRLRDELFDKVIPRLIRPMETNGRKIPPVLVHGDLWDGNASVDVNTGQPLIFDSTPIYAHNEYELAPWRCSRHKMKRSYIDEYTKHYPITEPVEDFEDRGDLYRLRFDLLSSSLYPGNLRFRKLMIENMTNLAEKFPLGYEGYLKEKGLSDGYLSETGPQLEKIDSKLDGATASEEADMEGRAS